MWLLLSIVLLKASALLLLEVEAAELPPADKPGITLDFDVSIEDPRNQPQPPLPPSPPPPPQPPQPPQPTRRRSTRQVVPYDEPGLARSAEVVRRCETEGPACRNGGHCDTFLASSGTGGGTAGSADQLGLGRLACMCPLGYSGMLCETEGSFRFPEFLGNGYLIFELADYQQASLTVSLEVLPKLHNGVLVYASGKKTFGEQFLALVLWEKRPQFRYNSGDGMRVLTHPQSLSINAWHTVAFHRSPGLVWIMVNGSRHSESGLNAGEALRDTGSRFQLDSRLFIAGFPRSVPPGQLASQTDSDAGFVGCLGNVTLNRRLLDPRQNPFFGDAIHGLNVYDCSMAVCRNHGCVNGGECHVTKPPSDYVCVCTNATGRYCETPLTMPITVPYFDGSAHARLRGHLRRTSRSDTELVATFRADSPTGLLMYAGYSRDTRGDFLALGLQQRRVFVAFDLGSGPAVIRSRHEIDLHRWITVKFSRMGRRGRLRVVGQAGAPAEGFSPGSLVQLDIQLDTFLGGHPQYQEVSQHLPVRTNFVGCLQALSLGELGRVEFPVDLVGSVGRNVRQCVEGGSDGGCWTVDGACGHGGECAPVADGSGRFACRCKLGFRGPRCEIASPRRQIRSAKFSGSSYLLYRDPSLLSSLTSANFSLSLQVRLTQLSESASPSAADQTLLLIGGPRIGPADRFLHLIVSPIDRSLSMVFNEGFGAVQTRSGLYTFDGNWHTVAISKIPNSYILYVDGLPKDTISDYQQGDSRDHYAQLLIGGLDLGTRFANQHGEGIVGCTKDAKLTVKDTGVAVQLTVESADDGRNVEQCSSP